MADKTISALTAATTPLAGSEVLPIVQSSTTKKVTVDDLTVKNIRSNATTGLLQIAGPAASSTRVMSVPDANFTAARTDAANSFAGNQTLSTGNLVVGTAGKGVDFSATPNAGGMTSELFADYEEGTWTPVVTDLTNDATMNISLNGGFYTKIGRQVFIQACVAVSSLGSVSGAVYVKGLPFTSSDTALKRGTIAVGYADALAIVQYSSVTGNVANNETRVNLFVWDTTVGPTQMQASELTASGILVFSGAYFV